MAVENDIHLLLDLDPEVARWRRRTTLLLSVVLHAVAIVLLLVSPSLLRRGAEMVGINLVAKPQTQQTFLWLPPEVLRRLSEPPPDTNRLSDRDRRAQGRSPIINPFGRHMPYSEGNTPLPEIPSGLRQLPPLPATPPAPPGGPATPPPPGGPNTPPTAEKKGGGLKLMDVPAQEETGTSRVPLPSSTPGEAIQQSLQAAARGRAGGPSGGGSGDSAGMFRNLDPNFSTEGPVILSDTRGVDFGPYLARVVYSVRRNWYAVIPESARLGQKGRVGIVFEILKDGSVPELRLVLSSGADALDRAAAAAIRASDPFPPLPPEFTGNHLILQFIFLYNIPLGY